MARAILFVEDNTAIREIMAYALEDEGCHVVTAQTVDSALAAVETNELDVALLDVNIGSTLVFPVAEALESRGIPFIFATATMLRDLPQQWRSYPYVLKPYVFSEIYRELCEVCGSGN